MVIGKTNNKGGLYTTWLKIWYKASQIETMWYYIKKHSDGKKEQDSEPKVNLIHLLAVDFLTVSDAYNGERTTTSTSLFRKIRRLQAEEWNKTTNTKINANGCKT